ncbi:hypothetical protein HYALB_00005850 [Hymenoscyphus albidus]|uniref:Uncharacterized protein n=1 Tax=Hymenoscyphus albidus TaxID=595503 RepID=A0A9N9Q616_9HELO|nr:hypothetical protein HYALB_00005850 [Hymenoscyphus albidus]
MDRGRGVDRRLVCSPFSSLLFLSIFSIALVCALIEWHWHWHCVWKGRGGVQWDGLLWERKTVKGPKKWMANSKPKSSSRICIYDSDDTNSSRQISQPRRKPHTLTRLTDYRERQASEHSLAKGKQREEEFTNRKKHLAAIHILYAPFCASMVDSVSGKIVKSSCGLNELASRNMNDLDILRPHSWMGQRTHTSCQQIGSISHSILMIQICQSHAS